METGKGGGGGAGVDLDGKAEVTEKVVEFPKDCSALSISSIS